MAATRLVVLANIGIAQVGTPLDLYERPENEIVARFIGSPAMNLWPGEVVVTGAQTKVKLADGCEAISDVPTTEADKGLKVNVCAPRGFARYRGHAGLHGQG